MSRSGQSGPAQLEVLQTPTWSSLALDGFGNLYVAGGGGVTTFSTIAASTDPLLFAAAAPEHFSATTQTITFTNVGNQPLNFSGLSNSSMGFPLESSCSTIAPGGNCPVALGFQPIVSGPITDTCSRPKTNASNFLRRGVFTALLSGSGLLLPQTINFAPIALPVIYAKQTIALTATGGASNKPVTFSVTSGQQYATVSGNQLTVTGAGTVIVEADQSGDGTTYADATPVVQMFVIEPASLTASLVGTITKTYDGGTSVPLSAANFQLTPAFAGDSVSLATEPATGTFLSPSVGSNIGVSAFGLTLTGAQAANYTLMFGGSVAGTGSITPASVTASVTALSKPYDGTTAVTITGCTLSVIDPNVTCVSTGAAFTDPNAGTNKTVIGLALAGPHAVDYQLASTSVVTTASITSASQVITFTPPPSTVPSTAPPITLQATASSMLPVSFTVTGPASIASGTNVLQFNGAGGQVVVTAHQSGSPNGDYAAAADVSVTITVVSTSPVQFPPTTVGQSSTINVPFVFSAGATVGSISVVTQGVLGLDFNANPNPSASTCVVGTTYPVGGGCYVSVVFSPITAGARFGAVVLSDSKHSTTQTIYMTGVGLAPRETFFNAAAPVSAFLTNTSSSCVTVDAGNNAFVCKDKSVVVYPGGPASTPVPVLVSSATTPTSVAIDGAGNLMINDGNFFEIPANDVRAILAGNESAVVINSNGSVTGNGFYLTFKVLTGICAGSFQHVTGVGDMKFDAVGNLFYGPGPLFELPNSNGGLDTSKVVLTGPCSAPTSAPPAIPVTSASGRSAFSNSSVP